MVADENSLPKPETDAQTPPAASAPAPAPARTYAKTLVRFGRMNFVGEFSHPEGMRFPCHTPVVIQTDRGIELGQPIWLTCPSSEMRIDREQIVRYVEASGSEHLIYGAGRILRSAREDDLGEARHLREGEREKLRLCQELADRMGLAMKVVECEHLLGGERIVFYFMSEGRIDFRELVRELAREFQTRIEMRQVGARDEARLIADFETCGRECCCKNFLKTLKPVTMKMAKMQKATLDPSKVSGRCGRLKCCLRYEQETYDDLDRRLPRMGTRVRTPHGEGTVVDRQILTQLVQIETADGQRIAVALEDVSPAQPNRVVSPPPEPASRDGDESLAQASGDGALAPEANDRPGGGRRRRGRRGRRRQQGEDFKNGNPEPNRRPPEPGSGNE